MKGPPNLGRSRQLMHLPQSSAKQFAHLRQHQFLIRPEVFLLGGVLPALVVVIPKLLWLLLEASSSEAEDGNEADACNMLRDELPSSPSSGKSSASSIEFALSSESDSHLIELLLFSGWLLEIDEDELVPTDFDDAVLLFGSLVNTDGSSSLLIQPSASSTPCAFGESPIRSLPSQPSPMSPVSLEPLACGPLLLLPPLDKLLLTLATSDKGEWAGATEFNASSDEPSTTGGTLEPFILGTIVDDDLRVEEEDTCCWLLFATEEDLTDDEVDFLSGR